MDYGLLALLTKGLGVGYQIAAAAGFSAGLLVNYGLSVAWVFKARRLRTRSLEFLGFFGVGLAGLGLNAVLMKGFVEGAGLDPLAAKIPSTGLGFLFNFITRRALLFTTPRERR
jgi:putative flippase GtrA